MRWYLIDGFAIEPWAIKVLLGIHYGGLSAFEGEATRTRLELDVPAAAAYLAGKPVEWPLGFYYQIAWKDGAAAALAPLVHGNMLGGLRVVLQSFSFDRIVATPISQSSTLTPKNRHRPPIIEIVGPKTTSILAFAWSGMSMGDTCFRTYWPPRL